MKINDAFPNRVLIPQDHVTGYTPYSTNNQAISDKGHIDAQRILYPRLFGVPFTSLEFQSTSLSIGKKERILDGEMAIDRLVRVRIRDLHAPLTFTIQERFRRPSYAKYRDLTVTEWNNNTNLPSELYKINAGIFLYGYHDPNKRDFIEAIAIDTIDLLIGIVTGSIKWTRGHNSRSNQDFFGFRFDDLKSSGCVLMDYKTPA